MDELFTAGTIRTDNEVRLSDYDIILINSSAGKDSQAMLEKVGHQAHREHVFGRLVIVHADLGEAEWGGTRDLAARQAKQYGLQFETTKYRNKALEESSLLEYIERRGKWPDSKNRYCTSDFKRTPISRVITYLVQEHREYFRRGAGRQLKVLNCLGIRAEESPARAKKQPFETGKDVRSTRLVDTWYPIFRDSVKDVWSTIDQSGVEHHQAYDLGMTRLSCVFCVFAPKWALKLAGEHNRALLDKYVEAEKRMGHTFRNGFSIAEIQQSLDGQVEDLSPEPGFIEPPHDDFCGGSYNCEQLSLFR